MHGMRERWSARTWVAGERVPLATRTGHVLVEAPGQLTLLGAEGDVLCRASPAANATVVEAAIALYGGRVAYLTSGTSPVLALLDAASGAVVRSRPQADGTCAV